MCFVLEPFVSTRWEGFGVIVVYVLGGWVGGALLLAWPVGAFLRTKHPSSREFCDPLWAPTARASALSDLQAQAV